MAHPLESPVLDIGCGDGHFASLAFRKRPIAGVDQALPSVLQARAIGAYDHCLVAGAADLPFRSGSFSTVVANCVLEHIPELEEALSESNRVLCNGGRFLLSVPSHLFGEMLLGSRLLRALGLPAPGQAYGDWFNRHSRHFHVDAPEVWRERLDRHGFTVVDWCYYMSPEAHRAFDLAHYLSIPRWISWKLTGRWVLVPLASGWFRRWLEPLYLSSLRVETGAYLFFECRKKSMF